MLRQRVAASVYSAAKSLRLDAAARNSSWRRRRLLVLCWHGISLDDEHLWRPGLYITPSLFRERLETLAAGNYNVLPLDEGLTRLWADDLPPRSVVITFDDGFYDFAVHAAPLLAEFGFPATVYLTTYYVDYQRPVFDLIVSYMLWKSCGSGRSLRDGTSLANASDALAASAKILRESAERGYSAQQKDDLSRELARELGIDYDLILRRRLLHLMTAGEVSHLAKGKITFELHTHRHRTPSETDLMRNELRDNARRIEELTGASPRHLCYPSGVFRPQYFPMFEEERVRSATTCELGMASHSNNRFMIPRMLDMMSLTSLQYEGWLSGVYALGRRTQ